MTRTVSSSCSALAGAGPASRSLQREMHALGRDRFAARNVEELADDVFRGRRGPRADDAEIAAATADLHVQAVFEQAQVFIQRAAQVREARVVRGLEIEFTGWGDWA